MTPTYDTIVIGTGVGGLTAGLSMIRKGHSVLMLEAADRFGGMLNPFVHRKYQFDVGIHYLGELGEGQSLRRLFDSLGLEDLRFKEINPVCIDRYVFADYETRLVKGIDRWGDTLVKDFPREEANIRSFLELMKECRELSRVTSRGLRMSDLPGVLRYGSDLMRLSRSSMAAVTERHFDDPMLRNVFAGPCADLGLPPSRASAFFSVSLLNHYLAGGYYPIGGSAAIRDAFIDTLRSTPAIMETQHAVTAIRVLGEKRFEVRTANGERFEARSVISNVHAARTMQILEGAQPSYVTRRNIARFTPSPATLCVFVATDLDLAAAGITDANIWHYGDDFETHYNAIGANRVPARPFFHLSSPTIKDPSSTRAPYGHSTLQLITFAPTDATSSLNADMAARLLEDAERYVPGLRDHIVYTETASYPRPANPPQQSLLNRAFTKVGIPGLYLAGASVFGGGVMPCMMSGVVAARAAEAHLQREAFGQLDDLSRAMVWVGRKAMLRSSPQKLHSNLHQLKRRKG